MARVDPDVSGNGSQVGRWGRSAGLHTDRCAPQVVHTTNFVLCEELVAADMHAQQNRHGGSGFDRLNGLRRKFQSKIRFSASGHRRRFTSRCIDIANLSKALRAQQLVGDVLRRKADAGELQNAHGCCFGDPLRGQHIRSTEKTSGAGHRQRGKKPASGLHHRLRKPPFP